MAGYALELIGEQNSPYGEVGGSTIVDVLGIVQSYTVTECLKSYLKVEAGLLNCGPKSKTQNLDPSFNLSSLTTLPETYTTEMQASTYKFGQTVKSAFSWVMVLIPTVVMVF